jgi:hypothetical protein
MSEAARVRSIAHSLFLRDGPVGILVGKDFPGSTQGTSRGPVYFFDGSLKAYADLEIWAGGNQPTPYVTVETLDLFYDRRKILQLAGDSTTPVDSLTGRAYTIVDTAIKSAIATIERAGVKGSDDFLRWLSAGLAYINLAARRGYSEDSLKTFVPQYDTINSYIRRL